MSITMEPIGTVKNNVTEPIQQQWEEIESELVLNPDLVEALEGLEEFSHIIVLFWMHRTFPQPGPWGKVHPRKRQDLPLVGLLATRSPIRPNSIGMTVVRLLERRENVLKVRGLDALDGTPVLDIKPYLPRGDCIPGAEFPAWVSQI